jgi:hypothetical protein
MTLNHLNVEEGLINPDIQSLRAERGNLVVWNQVLGDCCVTGGYPSGRFVPRNGDTSDRP